MCACHFVYKQIEWIYAANTSNFEPLIVSSMSSNRFTAIWRRSKLFSPLPTYISNLEEEKEKSKLVDGGGGVCVCVYVRVWGLGWGWGASMNAGKPYIIRRGRKCRGKSFERRVEEP